MRWFLIGLMADIVVACGGDNTPATSTAKSGCAAAEVERIKTLATSGGMSAYARAMQGVREMDATQMAAALELVQSARSTIAGEAWGDCGADIQAKLIESADANIAGLEKAVSAGDPSAMLADLDRGQSLYLDANQLLTDLAAESR